MKTIVLQSFRQHDVPAWLTACMDSARRWAASRAYDYRFMGDELFEILPGWFIQRAAGCMPLLSDLARALWARRLLESGYRRYVWIDADVLVFKPQAFDLEGWRSHAFCHEIWIHEDARSGVRSLHHKINNAVSVYVAGNPFLAFYIDAMERIARNLPLHSLALGTELLTRLGQALPMPLLPTVGLFNAPLLRDLASERPDGLRHYMGGARAELTAANLCNSFRGQTHNGIRLDDELYEKVVNLCLASQGAPLNRYFTAQAPAAAGTRED